MNILKISSNHAGGEVSPPAQPVEPSARDDRAERTKRLNESARLVPAASFVSEYLPKRPAVSKEFVAEPNRLVLNDSRPYRPVMSSGSADGSSGADPTRFVDSKRVVFDPEKHLLGDDGKPLLTATGRFRSIPKKDKDRIASQQRAKWAGINAEKSAGTEGQSTSEPVNPEEAEKEAGLWVDFCECLFTLVKGESAKMVPMPNGAHEKEMIARGIAQGFKKWRLLRFPALLGILLALGHYGGRVFKGQGPRRQSRPEPKSAEGQEVVVYEQDEPTEKPNRNGPGTPFDINEL